MNEINYCCTLQIEGVKNELHPEETGRFYVDKVYILFLITFAPKL